MSNAALHHVWKHSKAKGVALLVMIAIADMANDEGDCWPGRTSLAEKCRISERYSQVITNKLVAMGELEVFIQNGIDTSTGKTNRYHVVGVNSGSPLDDQRDESAITPGANGDSSLKGEGVNRGSPPGANGDSPDPSIDPSVKEQPSDDPSSSNAPGESGSDPAGTDGDDELQLLILPEVRKLHLPPDDQQALLALGTAQALAIAWAARKGHNPGGLAKHLMASGGAPDELLERAQIAIATKTLDAQAIDRALNARQLADLADTVSQITAARPPVQEPPTHATSDGIPESVFQRFDAALKTLLHPLAGEWVYGAQAIRYERDVLAVAVTGIDEKTALAAFRRALGDDAPFHVELKVLEEVPVCH